MKQYLYILCCIIGLIFPIKSIAEIITLNQSNIWRSVINKNNHEMVIIGHQYNLTVALFIIPNQLSVLKVIIPKSKNIDNTIQFTMDNIALTLNKSTSNHKDRNVTFYYIFQHDELKYFIHEFTAEQNAYITINNKSTALYLKGTSPSVSTILNYIDTHHIHPLPAPFNIYLTPTSIPTSPSSTVKEKPKRVASLTPIFSIKDYIPSNVVLIFCIISVIIIFRPLFKKFRYYRQKKYAIHLCQKEIQRQALQLQIKREQLIYKDEYGSIIEDKWVHEVNKFMKSRIEPLLSQYNLLNYYPELRKTIRISIYRTAKNKSKYGKNKTSFQNTNTILYHPKMNPLDYEEYCAQLLREIGWQATTTTASGDQGADVIAHKKNITLILQCKLYSKPVSNKAVQEVNSAKTFYRANFAAVISNAGYTISARQIASSTKIILLHHEELQEYAKTLA